MRTTVTLTPDVDSLVRRAMAERGETFAEVLNAAVRDGLTPASDKRVFRTRTFDMGEFLLPIDHINRVIADLDDEEILRKMERDR